VCRGNYARAQAANVVRVTRALESFSLESRDAASLASTTTRVCYGTVTRVDTDAHVVHLSDGQQLGYGRLCVCTGAAPRIAADHPSILGIRDDDVSRAGCSHTAP
jgi:NADPH-dependent 2,4-dienoyl-CoA reductase/sulfur reductase-like enzyme